jgi:uncharacterized RDD family membrane protein YckC
VNSISTEPNTSKRTGATIIDYVIIFAFSFGFVMYFGEPNSEGGKTVSGIPALVPMIFWFAWLVVPETIWGTTLGHHLNGLKVVTFEGTKPNFGQALKRRICDALEIIWCFGFIAFVLVKNTQFNQRLGDIWSKTLVVDSKVNLERNQFDFEKSEV